MNKRQLQFASHHCQHMECHLTNTIMNLMYKLTAYGLKEHIWDFKQKWTWKTEHIWNTIWHCYEHHYFNIADQKKKFSLDLSKIILVILYCFSKVYQYYNWNKRVIIKQNDFMWVYHNFFSFPNTRKKTSLQELQQNEPVISNYFLPFRLTNTILALKYQGTFLFLFFKTITSSLRSYEMGKKEPSVNAKSFSNTRTRTQKEENITKLLVNFQIPNLNYTNSQENIFLNEYTFSREFQSTITGVWMHIYLLICIDVIS